MNAAPLAALLALHAHPAFADWKVPLADSALTSYSAGSSSSAPARAWEAALERVPGGPIVAGGRVFVELSGKGVAAFDENTGKALWSYRPDFGTVAAPAIDEHVIVLQKDGLVGLDPSSGTVKWAASLQFPGAPAVAIDWPAMLSLTDKYILVWTTERVTAFWRKARAFSWSTQVDTDGPFALAGDTLYAPSRAEVVRLALNGKRKPSLLMPKMVRGVMAAGGDLIVALQDEVRRIDPVTGKEKWIWNGQTLTRLCALGPKTVVVVGKGGAIFGLDADSGAQKWSYAASQPVDTGIAIDDESVFIAPEDAYFYGLSLKNGEELFRSAIQGGATGRLVLSDGMIFVAGKEKRLAAYRFNR